MAILSAATATAMRRVKRIVIDRVGIMVMARRALAVAIGRATVMLIQSNCERSCNINNDDASTAGGIVTVTVTVIATVLVAVIVIIYVYMYIHEKDYSTSSTDTFSVKVGASSHGPPGI